MKISDFTLIYSVFGELTWEYEGLKKEIFDEHLKMWDVFRDPVTGLYCDSEKIDSGRRCGRWGNLYNQGPWEQRDGDFKLTVLKSNSGKKIFDVI